jgi:alpha-ribazole phosphatase
LRKIELELFLIRHGQSMTNKTPDIVGQTADDELSALGKIQSLCLASRLENEQFDFIFSSTYKRAMQTAYNAIGENFFLVDDLREYSAGDWIGKSRSEIITDSVKLEMGHMNNNFLPPNGESLSMVERRASQWLENTILYSDTIAGLYEINGKPIKIALFTHGMVIKTLLHYVMNFDKSLIWKIKINNASITKLTFNDKGWHIDFINNFDYLPSQHVS